MEVKDFNFLWEKYEENRVRQLTERQEDHQNVIQYTKLLFIYLLSLEILSYSFDFSFFKWLFKLQTSYFHLFLNSNT